MRAIIHPTLLPQDTQDTEPITRARKRAEAAVAEELCWRRRIRHPQDLTLGPSLHGFVGQTVPALRFICRIREEYLRAIHVLLRPEG